MTECSSPAEAGSSAGVRRNAVGVLPRTATTATAVLNAGLLADPAVKGLDPKVETHKGIVQLSGFVENQAQMERAIEIARAVDGVKSVENKMTVKK